MHNAAFAAAGIDGVYLPLAVRPERLAEAVAGLRALGFRGVNVTIPHKQAVLPFLDRLSPAAQAIGAANTIVVQEDDSLFGDNTDAPGFLADLAGHGIEVAALRPNGAVILGAGGSARAVTYALASSDVPVRVWARRPEQARQLAAAFVPTYSRIRHRQSLGIDCVLSSPGVCLRPSADCQLYAGGHVPGRR